MAAAFLVCDSYRASIKGPILVGCGARPHVIPSPHPCGSRACLSSCLWRDSGRV